MKRIKPGPGQESVWDYPRPPAIEEVTQHIRIIANGQVIYDSGKSYRILETSHPPTYYLPLELFKDCKLIATDRSSFCEFKGEAKYYHIKVGDQLIQFPAWGYKTPSARYSQIKNHVSVYAHMMDACFVGDEQVTPQEGDFYGGWITSKVVGPFKGGAGTWGW